MKRLLFVLIMVLSALYLAPRGFTSTSIGKKLGEIEMPKMKANPEVFKLKDGIVTCYVALSPGSFGVNTAISCTK